MGDKFLIAVGKFQLSYCSHSESKKEIANNLDTIPIFRWEDGMCSMEGEYKTSEFTKTELENTWILISIGARLQHVIPYYGNGNFERPNMDALNTEYKKGIKRLSEMRIVSKNKIFWEDLRQKRIQELNNEYKLKKITVEYFDNPAILENNDFTDSCLTYATALASEDTSVIIEAWEQLQIEKLKKNGAPEILEKRFTDMYNSEDKLLYAKYELLTYGWWNCANHQIPHISIDKETIDAFDKLFVKIKEECQD